MEANLKALKSLYPVYSLKLKTMNEIIEQIKSISGVSEIYSAGENTIVVVIKKANNET